VQIRSHKRGRATRFVFGGAEVLKPKQVVLYDSALMVLLFYYCAAFGEDDPIFPHLGGDGFRRMMFRMAQYYGVTQHQLVPRSVRPGGACYLHVELGWPLADLVIRGVWAKFESTMSYLQTGLYAQVALQLSPALQREAKVLRESWPRGLRLPPRVRDRMPLDIVKLFAIGAGGPWGMDGARRGPGVSGNSPPPRQARR
jgi:hypothetical protein